MASASASALLVLLVQPRTWVTNGERLDRVGASDASKRRRARSADEVVVADLAELADLAEQADIPAPARVVRRTRTDVLTPASSAAP
jgi:hypothetical protein